MRVDHYRLYVAHNNYMNNYLEEKRKQAAIVAQKRQQMAPHR
jgi:hypothetical protein